MKNKLEELYELKVISKKKNYGDYNCEHEKFDDISFHLKSNFAYLWLLDIVATDNHLDDERFSIKYVFLDVEENQLFSIRFNINESSEIKSIAHLWRNATVFEQEINELFGLRFSRGYTGQYGFSDSNYPMRKDFRKKALELIPNPLSKEYNHKIYPEFNLKRNLYELNLKVEDNLIQKCQLTGGNFHLGIEKILEGKNIRDTYQILESYYPNKAISWSHLLSTSIEDFHGIEISDRAQAIRMVLLEINRVSNHIQFLIEMSYEFAIDSLYNEAIVWMKRIQSLVISYTGNEFGKTCIRYGGVNKDISEDWFSRTSMEIVKLESSILQGYKNIIQNSYLKNTLSFRLMSKEVASSWSITGPLVRAVGINLDYRKLNPYYFYKDVDFEIPVGINGTGYDLLLVRIEEIFQSIKIIVQVLDNLPTGKIMEESINSHMFIKEGSREFDEVEYRKSVMGHLKAADFDTTKLIEGSNGIMSISINHRNNEMYRIKLGTPSFICKSLFERSMAGCELNQVKPFWTMLDIDLKEAER